MWDIQLQSLENINEFISYFFITFFSFFKNLINYSHTSIKINNYDLNYTFVFNSSIIFGIKFLLCIVFLVLIRGGTPRYRYDYLTKLGWLKFINIILFIFLFSLFNFYLF